jgi:hypothetical protein
MNIVVPPNVTVPGPYANYNSVTINSGGSLQIYVQTTVTITTLTKNS